MHEDPLTIEVRGLRARASRRARARAEYGQRFVLDLALVPRSSLASRPISRRHGLLRRRGPAGRRGRDLDPFRPDRAPRGARRGHAAGSPPARARHDHRAQARRASGTRIRRRRRDRQPRSGALAAFPRSRGRPDRSPIGGIDRPRPWASWRLRATRRGVRLACMDSGRSASEDASRRISILVAEDNDLYRRGLVSVLADRAFAVLGSASSAPTPCA